MTRRTSSSSISPENAEHEIRKAYNTTIETGVTHFWDHRALPGVDPNEVNALYKHAFQCFRKKNLLAAERWARTAKHLARAFWHEAKIAYLEPRSSDLPFLKGASDEDYNLKEHSDTTEDLLNSVANHIPQGKKTEVQEEMERYLSRGRDHLTLPNHPEYTHELLRVERIKAAHEYGRVLECMTLAVEAETVQKAA